MEAPLPALLTINREITQQEYDRLQPYLTMIANLLGCDIEIAYDSNSPISHEAIPAPPQEVMEQQ